MERKGKTLSKAQFLQRFDQPKATMRSARDILARIETKTVVTYVSRGGNQYLECVVDDTDEISVINGGRWRVWVYNDFDFIATLRFLEGEVFKYHESVEELPF